MTEDELKIAVANIRFKITFLKAAVEIATRNPEKNQHINVVRLQEEIDRLEKVVRNK